MSDALATLKSAALAGVMFTCVDTGMRADNAGVSKMLDIIEE